MKSMKMIGLTNQVNGLYKSITDTRPTTTTTTTTPLQHTSLVPFPHKHVNITHIFPFLSIISYESIWHFKLGHLSNSRLYDMYKLHMSITNDNKSFCEICHFAKQTKNFTFLLVIFMPLLNLSFFILIFEAQLQPHQFMAIITF